MRYEGSLRLVCVAFVSETDSSNNANDTSEAYREGVCGEFGFCEKARNRIVLHTKPENTVHGLKVLEQTCLSLTATASQNKGFKFLLA